MSYRKVALGASCLILCLAAAGAALAADGDDDASFGVAGAAYLKLADGSNPSGVLVDQAPDGSLVAGVVDWTPSFRRGDVTDTQLRVMRFSTAGALLDAGEPGTPLPDGGGELFDLRVLADGTVVATGELFNDPQRRLFAVVDRPADPPVVSFATFPECPGTVADDARIRPDGGVVAVWRDCQPPDASRLQRFELDGDDELDPVWSDESDTLYDEDSAVVRVSDIALLDSGDIFVAGFATEATEDPDDELDTRKRGGGFDAGAVQRFGEDGERVTAYGDVDGTKTFPGVPNGLGLGADGRAVAPVRAEDPDVWSFVSLTPDGAFDDDFGGDGLVDIEDDELCCDGATAVTVQGDGKVVALKAIDGDGPGTDPTIVARLKRDGTLDESFGGDGVRTFAFDATQLYSDADPLLQADGRVVVPFLATRFERQGRIAEPQGTGYFAALYRFGGTAQAPGTTTTAVTPVAAPPPAPAAASSVAARSCRSRRTFAIRLRTGRRKAEQSPIVSATVLVNGKKVKVTRAARQRASVDLKNLPKGRFTVSIRLRLKDGGIVRETRRYRTCAQKVERELGPLRTRPPRR